MQTMVKRDGRSGVSRGHWRSASAAVLAVTASVGMSGCDLAPPPFACPAIGWVNVLTVELDGVTSGVASVQLCTDDGCAPADDVDPDDPLGYIELIDRDGAEWVFSVDMSSPDDLTVRTIAADGEVLTATAISPQWTRTGGDDRCGGPMDVTVTVAF